MASISAPISNDKVSFAQKAALELMSLSRTDSATNALAHEILEKNYVPCSDQNIYVFENSKRWVEATFDRNGKLVKLDRAEKALKETTVNQPSRVSYICETIADTPVLAFGVAMFLMHIGWGLSDYLSSKNNSSEF